MNCIRKHLSASRRAGGGGGASGPRRDARYLRRAGDDPAVIASGPTVPDPTTFAEARALVAHYGMQLPPAVARHLESAQEESPKPGDPRLAGAELRMIATPLMALRAMAAEARGDGPRSAHPRRCAGGGGGGARQGAGGIARGSAAHGLPVGGRR
jgi:glycerate-2-kinase